MAVCLFIVSVAPASADELTTAWGDGQFVVDTPNVVRRSNIVLERANFDPTESMALGNGTLGAAIWAADGLTAQLNRGDTLPDRKSPGRVVIPGLARLTAAPDFQAHLDLYDAVLTETGGGMTARVYVRSDADELIVDVSGADPGSMQTAQVGLWDGRQPHAQVADSLGLLAETWTDTADPGGSGEQFGSLAVISAAGQNVNVGVLDPRTVGVHFNPRPDGTFRVVVAAPYWPQSDPSISNMLAALPLDAALDSDQLESSHAAWWHAYWSRVGLMRMSSADGSAEYLENVRTVYLYASAAEGRGTFPGSQAGVADLFSFSQLDDHDWDPAAYWIWNLRMQQAANLSTGAFELNAPLYRLYLHNYANLQKWTASHLPGYDGICIPETMRFNGNGYYYGTIASTNASCDSTVKPQWNSLTITSGAEVGLWVWQQYLMTDDRQFLADNYPLMSGPAHFLLSYARVGADGFLHTESNAHETQWSVKDPVTDVAAMQALFPAVAQAATTLGIEPEFAAQLTSAIPKIRPLPRTDAETQRENLGPEADSTGTTVISPSAEPMVAKHNDENIGLEPVWPYSIIGDSGPQLDLARRTYAARPSKHLSDWSFDPLYAARLGLGEEVANNLRLLTQAYQVYPSGLSALKGSPGQEPYIEQSAVLTAALNDALVQDYDGLLRIAPAVPSDWDLDGTVFIQHQSQVHVQVHQGIPVTVVVDAGADYSLKVRNPWPGQTLVVLDQSGKQVIDATAADSFSFNVKRGSAYIIQRASQPISSLAFAPVSGRPASVARHLHRATIGLAAP